MHVHGHQPSMSSTSLAGAHAAESAAAMKRARELREAASRLKAASQGVGLETGVSPDAVSMIGSWSQGENGTAGNQRKTVSGERDEGAPGTAATVSYWA